VARKLLITGAAGQLGQALLGAVSGGGWEAVATDVHDLDIADPQVVWRELARHRR
jgi:dTDP-4-dehydrorhamnose reductase